MTDLKIHKTPLSLGIERTIEGSRDIVWRCWTESELLKRWFSPAPWTVPSAELDARPGGKFNLTMAGPEGDRTESVSSYILVDDQKRLIFSDAYSEGFVPQPDSFMTGIVELSDTEDGKTRMVWTARHATEKQTNDHLQLGFEHGWPAAAEQLNQLAKELSQ